MNLATARSCVTIITDNPNSLTKDLMRSSNLAWTDTSSPPVGSSINISLGFVIRFLAI